jgi:hypothetical protein
VKRFTLFLICIASATAEPPGIDQSMEFVMPPTGGQFICWHGKAGRTYFVQVSSDAEPLQKWTWAPMIETGNNQDISHEVFGTAPRGFFRLKYTDDPIPEGQTPEDTDFDFDYLTNWEEISIHHTDPLMWDSDGDGLGDYWEISNNLDPNDATGPNGASGDPDSDGLSNIEECWNYTNPHNSDTDGDLLSDGDEVHIHHSYPWMDDSDWDGIGDYEEAMLYSTNPLLPDTDTDNLTDYDEIFIFLTNPLEFDSDGDWMWDDYEIDNNFDPLDPADGLLDADEDTLANQLEFVFMDQGYDPFVANNAAIFPWAEDPDWDGLNTQTEFVTHLTNPRQPDTDGDGYNDSWEIAYGFNPKLNNAKAGLANQKPDADPDGEGLTNAQEAELGTNPYNADSDGDGVNDKDENDQGSNPIDPNDNTPPPAGTIPVNVTFGDHSGSHSEKYRVQLTPLEGDTGGVRFRTNRQYGQTQTDTFRLPKGAKYKVDLVHVATKPNYRDFPNPDFDYTLQVFTNSADEDSALIPEDPQGILGIHNESDDFFAAGKNATLYTAVLTSETVATLPTDRKRNKIGVGEVVRLTLKPDSLPNPTWQLTGDYEFSILDTTTETTATLTAGSRVCSPTAEVMINGQHVSLQFPVVEPTGIVMRKKPGTGIEHTINIPSAGFIGSPYITPDDVSFAGGDVWVREGICNPSIATGYYSYQSNKQHSLGNWKKVVVGDTVNPSKVDTDDGITSGNNGPAVPAPGVFEWIIPMSYNVSGGVAKEFTHITHHQECDTAGTVTIQKDAGPFSAALGDPTYPPPP